MTEIQEILFAHSDPAYADFIAKLVPTLPREQFIGVRSPEYRKIVKELPDRETVRAFTETLPHRYHEENVLHAVLICTIRDPAECMEQLERFLPCVNNWAVCDGLVPAVFRKDPGLIREKLPVWIASDRTYTRRFGLHMLMTCFLDERFEPGLLEMAASARSDEYYVNMMTAWLFAEALAKQWDAAIPYIGQRRLDPWTHNKAIQKAIESRRITEEQKRYLRSLKQRSDMPQDQTI